MPTLSDSPADSPTRHHPLTLSDGTALASLVDHHRRRIQARLFTDPEIYHQELERIFARAWLVIAHESEIPHPGDYVTRFIGEDPVIVVRNAEGTVKVLLNVCSHRAMGVCPTEAGHTRFFQCPYHGWRYDADGHLVSVPAERAMYDEELDRSSLSLQAARSDTCAGWIFATFDDRAPSLAEFLGPMAFYMRVAFERTAAGVSVAGLPERWVLPANWKLAADQFAGDAYHVLSLHGSMSDLGYMAKNEPLAVLDGINVSCREGHHVRLLKPLAMFDENAPNRPPDELAGTLPGLSPDLMAEVAGRLGPDELALALSTPPSTGNVYPNAFWLTTKTPPLDGRPSPGLMSMRVIIPRGPDSVEIMNWALYEQDLSPEDQQAGVRNAVQTFSASGIWEQDDTEAWVAIQRALRGVVGQRRWLTYGAMSPEPTDEFPGMTWRGVARDNCQWLAWERYFSMMAGD